VKGASVGILEDDFDLLPVERAWLRHGDSVYGKYLRPGAGGCGCGEHYRSVWLAHGLYCAGYSGLFIAAGIYLFTRDNPKDHPAITQQDLVELAADDRGSLQDTSAIAFKDVLKMPVLWQMAGIWFLFDITFWGFSTWLPSYLITVREFSLAKTGDGGNSSCLAQVEHC
jgi:sugar phosphate permease